MNQPICVDLDGTLIEEDIGRVSLKKYLAGNLLRIFRIISWSCKGRAYCKAKLARRVDIPVESLTYNRRLLDFLVKQRELGRKIYLATGANELYARKIADYLGFDGVLASNSEVNLIEENKANTLRLVFGNEFTYIGNSNQDVPVWDVCNEAILVAPTKMAACRMKDKKHRNFDEISF